MTLRLLTALDPRHEADLVAALGGQPGLQVVRRCADVPELVSVAASGQADVALVSAGLRGLDRELLRTLAGHGVRVVGLCERSDEIDERRLRQLGVGVVVHPDDPVADLAATIRDPGPVVTWPEGSPVAVSPDDAPHLDGRPTTAAPQADPDHGDDRPPGRVVAVWGPIGSPGRTTVAIGLAAHLADRGVRVLLVDADTWGASVGQHLGLVDEAPGLAAAARLSEHGHLDLPALARVAPEVGPGWRVLTGLPRPDRWPEIRAAAMEDVLGIGRRLADVVVVDCGFSLEDDEDLSYDTAAPRRNAATLAVLGEADEVVVLGSADPVGLQRLIRGIDEVGARTAGRCHVVVTKLRRGASGPGPERAIRDVLGRFSTVADPVFLPWSPAECDAALWAGSSVVTHAPRSLLAQGIGRLADLIQPGAGPGAGAGAGAASRRGRRRARRQGSVRAP